MRSVFLSVSPRLRAHLTSMILRIPRNTCRMRSSFSTRAQRTWPSLEGPRPNTWLAAALASVRSSLLDSDEPGGGRALAAAQTNIVPRGLCTGQLRCASPSQSVSRRFWWTAAT